VVESSCFLQGSGYFLTSFPSLIAARISANSAMTSDIVICPPPIRWEVPPTLYESTLIRLWKRRIDSV
jgi:hypothetical protein